MIVNDSLVYHALTRISARETLRTRVAVPLDSIAHVEYKTTDAGRTALLVGGVLVAVVVAAYAGIYAVCSQGDEGC